MSRDPRMDPKPGDLVRLPLLPYPVLMFVVDVHSRAYRGQWKAYRVGYASTAEEDTSWVEPRIWKRKVKLAEVLHAAE